MTITADRAIGDHILTKTHIADEAIEGNRFVKLVTPVITLMPHVVYADAGESACGVMRTTTASGALGDVVKMGQAWVTTSENVAAGQSVSADADGKAQVAASTELVCGAAQTDANSGELVLVLLSLGGIY